MKLSEGKVFNATCSSQNDYVIIVQVMMTEQNLKSAKIQQQIMENYPLYLRQYHGGTIKHIKILLVPSMVLTEA